MTKAFKPNPADAALFSAIYGRIPPNGGAVTITRDEWVAFGNLAGALNWAVADDPAPPTPGPAPTDPLARLTYRANTFGFWAAWFLMERDEETAARAAFGDGVVSRLNNFYQGGGGGGLRVNGKMGADGVPRFFRADEGEAIAHPDVDRAADRYVAEMAKAQGRDVEPSPIGEPLIDVA